MEAQPHQIGGRKPYGSALTRVTRSNKTRAPKDIVPLMAKWKTPSYRAPGTLTYFGRRVSRWNSYACPSSKVRHSTASLPAAPARNCAQPARLIAQVLGHRRKASVRRQANGEDATVPSLEPELGAGSLKFHYQRIAFRQQNRFAEARVREVTAKGCKRRGGARCVWRTAFACFRISPSHLQASWPRDRRKDCQGLDREPIAPPHRGNRRWLHW
jgi:hypothetical protein